MRRALWASAHFLGVAGRFPRRIKQSSTPRPEAGPQMPELLPSTKASVHQLEPITPRAAWGPGSGQRDLGIFRASHVLPSWSVGTKDTKIAPLTLHVLTRDGKDETGGTPRPQLPIWAPSAGPSSRRGKKARTTASPLLRPGALHYCYDYQ